MVWHMVVVGYPLAQALAKMQDRCIERYPSLYGSDDRIHACMSELGVPLTKEPGFHQIDLRGSLFGLLVAHPITPLVTVHHFDLVEPIFPNEDKFQALERLMVPAKLDSAALMQQSICHDKARSLTVSISWGYAVQIFRGILYPREVEMVARTFLSWHRTADPYAFAFNNRPYVKNRCQKPFVYFYSDESYNNSNEILSENVRNWTPNQRCRWRTADPAKIVRVKVYKQPDPYLWDRAPRRNCCRILPRRKRDTLFVEVGECREDEVIELQ